MKYVWAAVTIVATRFIITAVYYPPVDGDIIWQRQLGKTILETRHIPRFLGSEAFAAVGAPWTPQEWLFSIVAALSTDSWKRTFFATFIALCAIATILLTARRALRHGAAPAVIAGCTLMAGIALLDSFGVRAQVLAWPMLALMLLLLENDGPSAWATVPLAAVWSNLHASAILAPLLAGAIGTGRFLEDRSCSPRVKRAFGVTIAVAAAICCNPFGIGLPMYAVNLFTSPIRAYISEWRETDIGMYAFLFGALPLLLGMMVSGMTIRGRRILTYENIILFSAFTFLLFFAYRNIAIFVIVVAPLCAKVATEVFVNADTPDQWSRFDRAMNVALPIFVVLVSFGLAHSLLSSPKRTEITMPLKEIAALEKMPGEHRIFCGNFAWCSYFVGVPKQNVFLDGRSDPYPPYVWKQFGKIVYVWPEWRGIVDDYHMNAFITERDTPIDQAIATTHGWKNITQDMKFRLWIKKKHGALPEHQRPR